MNISTFLGEEGGEVTLKSFYEAAEKGELLLIILFNIN